jgi:DivIVA domain-containing protein
VPRLGTVVSALIYLVVALVAAGVVFLLASIVFGRGEELEALPPGSTPTRLPPANIEGSDVRSLRFQQVFRGYKASEVDWALARLADELDDLRGRVTVLERQAEAAGERIQQIRAPEQED